MSDQDREYREHLKNKGSNPYKDRIITEKDVTNPYKELLKENEIMSEPKEELCIKTLEYVINRMHDFAEVKWFLANQVQVDPKEIAYELGQSHVKAGIQRLIINEFAKESESK